MTGQHIRDVLRDNGVIMASLAKLLGITPQALNSKLKSVDVSFDFVNSIANAINKDVYFFTQDKNRVDNVDNTEGISNDNKDEIIELQREVIAMLKEKLKQYESKPSKNKKVS